MNTPSWMKAVFSAANASSCHVACFAEVPLHELRLFVDRLRQRHRLEAVEVEAGGVLRREPPVDHRDTREALVERQQSGSGAAPVVRRVGCGCEYSNASAANGRTSVYFHASLPLRATGKPSSWKRSKAS